MAAEQSVEESLLAYLEESEPELRDDPEEPDDDARTAPESDDEDEPRRADAEPDDGDEDEDDAPAAARDETPDDGPGISTLSDLAKAFEVEEADLAQAVKVKIGEQELPLAEVIRGYGRGGDDAPEVSEQLQVLSEAEAQRKAQFTESYEKLAGLTNVLIQSIQPEREPDWERLRKEDPGEYAALRADWDRRRSVAREAIETMRAEVERQQQADQAQRDRDLQEFKRAERVKLRQAGKAFPEWSENGGKAGLELVESYLEGQGFTKDEIAKYVVDHREILMVFKAAKYDALAQKADGLRQKKLKNLPKLVSRGARRTPEGGEKTRSMDRQYDRLRRTGRVRDAAPLMEQFVED